MSSSAMGGCASSPDRISIAAGSLDPPTRLRASVALFGDDASDYHTLDRSIETLPRDSSPSCADG